MKTFNVLSKDELAKLSGGKLLGASHGTIVGWNYTNGIYYVDIQYEGGSISCGVEWGSAQPQIGDLAG